MNEIVFSSVLSISLAAIGVVFTIKYSSKFHINKKNKAKEMYKVLEKISHGTKSGFIDSARIILYKSNFDKALGFMDVSLTTDEENINVDRSAFIHSCIHNVIAPGKILLNSKNGWKEKVSSNEFDEFEINSKKIDKIDLNIIPNIVKKKGYEVRAIKSKFIYPNTYTGPRYKERITIFAKGIGIIYCKTTYINENVDEYFLQKYKILKPSERWIPFDCVGNYWIYKINYENGPNLLSIAE